MEHVRPIGKSYTTLTLNGTARRGVSVNPHSADTDRIAPDQVPALFKEDSFHVLRLVISTLDKTVKKRGSLAAMHEDAYLDRGKLANALWNMLVNDGSITVTDDLRERWRAKVHPYLRSSSQYFDNPELDKNYTKIRDLRMRDNPQRSREDFEGNWHVKFWCTKGNRPDYDTIAKAMISDVFEQERKLIRQKEATDKQPEHSVRSTGRLQRSASAITKSTHDPREDRKSKPRVQWDDGDDPSENSSRPVGDWAIYCGENAERDLAAQLCQDACNALLDAWGEGRTIERPPLNRQHFGEKVYAHFGSLKGTYDEERKGEIFSLNFAVRKHYAKIAASNRFRQIWTDVALHERLRNKFSKKPLKNETPDRSAAMAIISRVMPASWKELRNQLRGKERNANVSQLLRLGKMVIHAADIPFDTPNEQADALFHKRLDFFATSDGQSEIKRNEAFNRIWRNAINIAVQTQKNFLGIDPADFDIDKDLDRTDIGIKDKLSAAIDKLTLDAASSRAAVIFGSKTFKFDHGERSRTDMILGKDAKTDTHEVLNVLGLCAIDLRNKAFHFSTMKHVLATIEKWGKENPAEGDAQLAFRCLLSFDNILLQTAWLEEVKALELRNYLSAAQLQHFASETGDVPLSSDLPTPKFRALMKYIGDLVRAEETPDKRMLKLSEHALDADSLTKPGPNRTRVGMLRLAYQRGFESWLSTKLADKDLMSKTLERVRNRGLNRSKEMIRERNLSAAIASSRIDKLQLKDTETLADLLARLSSDATKEERIHQQYRPNKAKQKEISNDIEKLRREVFAELFAAYLDDQDLNWMHDVVPIGEMTDATPEVSARVLPSEAWCPLFYGWLYMLPPEDISLLQHQFRKTMALENAAKAAARSPTALDKPSDEEELEAEKRARIIRSLDHLMGLYIRVQGTGFDGSEVTLQNEFGSKKDKEGHLEHHKFFEENEDFETLFDPENDETVISRTRRGFRQIQRFGHLDDLAPIYAKHPVKSSEVKRATAVRKADDSFEKTKNDARDAILEYLRAEKAARIDKKLNPPVKGDLDTLVAHYREAALQATQNRFDTHAARLNDHFRAHDILRRICGRLTDYAEIWERDRACMFIGMVFQQANGVAGLSRVKGSVKLTVGDWKEQTIWRRGDGFDAHLKFYKHLGLLNVANESIFVRYFLKSESENKLDQARRKRFPPGTSGANSKSKFRDGPNAIRVHLAHFQILRRGRLTYLTNAVRSMLSYDRKLKNAVSKSIIDLIGREGMSLDWEMYDDRLRSPRIGPKLEQHLGFLQHREGEFNFELPQASPRLTSTMQGLFYFERRGHQPDVDLVGKEINYPSWFKNSSGVGCL